MDDLLVAIGLAMALEGALYALFPDAMRGMLRRILTEPTAALRIGGVLFLIFGCGVVWMVRG